MEDKRDEPKKGNLARFVQSRTWMVIQLIVPVVGVIVPIVIYVISQQSGEIIIDGLQRAVLIDTSSDIREGVTILYEDTKIANITKYILRIKNRGNRDIDGSDIHDLRWFPPTGSKILSAEVMDRTDSAGEFIILDYALKDVLRINLLTLNRNVFATIGILCSSDIVSPDLSTSRIEGVVNGASIIDHSINFQTDEEPSFFENIFAGGIGTNLAKVIIFFIIFIILAIIIIAPIAKLVGYIHNARRTRQLAAIKNDIDYFIVENKISDNYRDYILKSFSYFRQLPKSKLQLCLRLFDMGNDLFDFALSEGLTTEEKELLRSLPEIEFFRNDLVKFSALYESEKVIQFLLNKMAVM